MILADTGPIVAILDIGDTHHRECLAIMKGISAEPLITTWVCFTEAMYLLGSAGAHRYQTALWDFYFKKHLILHDLSTDEVNRMAELMAKYYDTPMDLGDASLVAVAESLSLRRIFTLDSDFRVYRLADRSALEIIP